MPTLQDQLDTITANTRALLPAEKYAVTDDSVLQLLSSGIESAILPVGAPAPGFNLEDALTQKAVASADLLAVGPLVIKFFRGRWCPYCMTELEVWQRLYPTLRERGAMLVAISPQLRRQNDFIAQQLDITFPLLSDPGARVAAGFGAAYTVPEPLRSHYRSILINIPFLHGQQQRADGTDATWQLPVPATFVVSQAGIITFAEAHADHRVRPEPQDVLAAI